METRNDLTVELAAKSPPKIARWRKGVANPSRESINRQLMRVMGARSLVCTVAGFVMIPFALLQPVFWTFVILLFINAGLEIRRGPYRPTPQAKAMMDLPAMEDQFPVVIRLLYRNIQYGSDQGVLSVMDGGLLFSGALTDFSLTPAKARLEGLWVRCRRGKQRYVVGQNLDFSLTRSDGVPAERARQPFYSIHFWREGFEGSLEIVPMARTLTEATLQTRELGDALAKWSNGREDQFWKDLVFPPTTTQPGLVASYVKGVRIGAAILVFVTLGGFVAVLAGWTGSHASEVGTVLLLVWLTVGFGAGYETWSTIKSLRALESPEDDG